MLGFNLSTPAGIIMIVVALILVFFAVKLLSGILRVLITILLFAVIIGVVYMLITKGAAVGSAIANMLPGLIFLRGKNGYVWFFEKKERS